MTQIITDKLAINLKKSLSQNIYIFKIVNIVKGIMASFATMLTERERFNNLKSKVIRLFFLLNFN